MDQFATSLSIFLLLMTAVPLVAGPIRFGLWIWSKKNKNGAQRAVSVLNGIILIYFGLALIFVAWGHFDLTSRLRSWIH